jgi:hypothetical protein
MKRSTLYAVRLILLATIIALPLTLVFAQTGAPSPIGLDFGTMFASIAAVAAAVLHISEAANKFIFSDKLVGVWAQLVSHAVSIIICGIGYYLKIGFFGADAIQAQPWYLAVPGFGIVIGFVANGVFGTDTAQALLVFLKLRPADTTTTPTKP